MAGERAGKSEIRMAGGLFFLRFFQALDLSLDDQLFIAAQRHAVLLGEPLSAFANKINVRALIEHQAGGADGIAYALHAPNATSAKGGAIHHEGIKLHASVAGKKTAAAGVKRIVIFHADNGGFHGVQRGAATFQNVPALGQRLLDADCVGFHHIVRNGPGAAVDHDYRELSQCSRPLNGDKKRVYQTSYWLLAIGSWPESSGLRRRTAPHE